MILVIAPVLTVYTINRLIILFDFLKPVLDLLKRTVSITTSKKFDTEFNIKQSCMTRADGKRSTKRFAWKLKERNIRIKIIKIKGLLEAIITYHMT